MRDTSTFSKIFLATFPVDFRKQARGLCEIVKNRMEANFFDEKSLFVFVNRRKDAVKLLYWDATGVALWWKVLEKESFKWPRVNTGEQIRIGARELKWLLSGIDITKVKPHDKLNFSETS